MLLILCDKVSIELMKKKSRQDLLGVKALHFIIHFSNTNMHALPKGCFLILTRANITDRQLAVFFLS